ncbi:trypsin-like peptidase domain-containing protein [Chloroflexi bacterium TSY]|nr:trypsin-like peptidase domain-containing protein [Chloroflexi bacterium TSY]
MKRFVFLVFVLLLTACQPILLEETQTSQQVEVPKLTLQTASPGAPVRKAVEIFADLSGSVAFVETPSGTGSGVLIEHGYLLTNAHVVWPYETVRIVFPNDSEHLDIPVYAWDLMTDLALIGPLETDLATVPLVDGTDLDIGSDVYLIGYPAELEEFPQPAVTSGILSRKRSWDALDYSFFQVDATITGGQSGGILVTQTGDVVGISTFYFSGFGLASSVADALPRLNAMLTQETDQSLGARRLLSDQGNRKQNLTLQNDWDTHTYFLVQPKGTEIELTVEGSGGSQIVVGSVLGYYLEKAADRGEETLDVAFEVEDEVPYLIHVTQSSSTENSFSLTSSHPLFAYDDPDDGRMVQVDETIIANMDTLEDVDYYQVELAAGDIVQIIADSLGIDPQITLSYESNSSETVVSDDDSGGGIFGQSAKIVYQAPQDDTYTFAVRNYSYNSIGGYFLTVEKAADDAELTEPEVMRSFLNTGFGQMEWYTSEENRFSLMRPSDWPTLRNCGNAIACFGGEVAALMIFEEDLSRARNEEQTLEGYADLMEELFEINIPDFKLVSRERVETLQKQPAEVLVFTAQAERMTFTFFTAIDEAREIAFGANLVIDSRAYDIFTPLVDFIHDSFRIWDEAIKEDDPVFYLDQAVRLASDDQNDAALESLTHAIEQDQDIWSTLKISSNDANICVKQFPS